MDNTYYIGIDIGGTRHNIGLSAQDGILVEHVEKQTDRLGGPKAMISSIVEIINQLISKNNIDKSRIKRIGIGFGGPVNSYKGIVIRSVHVDGWDNYPLAQEIANLVNIPVIIDNDVNAAVLGEWYFGAGKGFQNIFYVNIGTGIGGGAIVNNQLMRGASMNATEIGHLKVTEIPPRLCGCGSWGCLEALCSGDSIGRRAEERITYEDSILKIYNQKISGKMVYDAADQGDLVSREIIDQSIKILGTKIADVVTLFNPDLIIIGGGIVSRPNSSFLNPLTSVIKRNAMKEASAHVHIVKARNGYLAGVTGAVALAIHAK